MVSILIVFIVLQLAAWAAQRRIMTTIMVYGWYHLALLAVFPACERNTCRIRQVLNGGAKVRVIGMTWLVV